MAATTKNVSPSKALLYNPVLIRSSKIILGPMAYEDEAAIVKAIKQERTVNIQNHVLVSGVVVDAYEFDDVSKPLKSGHILHANKREDIPFSIVGQKLEGSMTGKTPACFLVSENTELTRMKNVLKMGFNLKNVGILKPIFVAQSDQNPQVVPQGQVPPPDPQLPKVVSGFSPYDQSFIDWLTSQNVNMKTRGPYLFKEEKQMLRTAYAAIDEMWNNDYTCDSLADPASYVMIGWRIKILPHLIRRKVQTDIDVMPLRTAFADLIENNLASLWANPELHDFILLLKKEKARTVDDIFGHPILLTPGRRQILYRTFSTRRISVNMKNFLNKIPFSPHWRVNKPHNHVVLDSICQNRTFSNDVVGALMFADMVSRHYVEHAKIIFEANWVNHVREDTIDRALIQSVPGLLSKRYAQGFDADYPRPQLPS
ncbi:hypothetical protein CFC21_006978 [Triticum aestivum]|uniref:Uncharacterized protein n=3 Tax=Triticum aestivum TaxID=4565 RepID=A0A9R1DD42_WHEAT|nr:hypothetical protein CFC21_006978 [Triticum aestivum]